MAYYKLIREAPGPSEQHPHDPHNAVRGTLYTVEHRYSGSTGQYKEYLTPICDTLENIDCLVPALCYKIAVTHSPRFKRLLPVLQQVPGRAGIRIHRGTKPEHSKGCILVSAENEQKLTALWLKEQNEHEETRIEFCK